MVYKVNIQKLMAFLYTNNEITETETRKNVPFTITTRKIKYVGVNLTTEVNLYLENYRTLKKEIKEYTNKWKHILCPWIERINIIKMSILPKAIYRSNKIPSKRHLGHGIVKPSEKWMSGVVNWAGRRGTGGWMEGGLYVDVFIVTL